MEKPPPSRLPQRATARHVLEFLPLVPLAFACGVFMNEPLGCAASSPAHGPRYGPGHAPSAWGSATTAVGSTEEAAPALAFAALAARGPRVAPGMHEVARMQNTGDKVEIARAEGRDACVRVAFEASAPVLAKLIDAQGNVLASSDKPATGGVLGEHGPVCVRRGQAVSALAEGSGASVRWMAWASP
jgi:hypothetical protein